MQKVLIVDDSALMRRKICDIIIQITTKETDSEEGNRYK